MKHAADGTRNHLDLLDLPVSTLADRQGVLGAPNSLSPPPTPHVIHQNEVICSEYNCRRPAIIPVGISRNGV